MGNNSIFERRETFIQTSIIWVFGIYLFFIQFTTSYLFIHMLPIPTPALLSLGISFLILVYYFYLVKGKGQTAEYSDRSLKKFVFLFLLAIVLSIFSAIYTLNVIKSVEYVSYVKGSMLTRSIYYATFLIMLYYGYKIFSRMEERRIVNLIKVYPLSIFILVLVGIWQLLYFSIDIPFLDITTRSYIHSVTGTSFFNFRLTSFADEPSYLGPFLIDMLILGYLAFKKKWMYVLLLVIPTMVVLIFSFSVSGYFNLMLLVGFLFLYLIFHPKVPKKYLWAIVILAVVVLVGVILLKPGLFEKFFSPILGRMPNLFNPQSSTRIYMYIMPFYWLFDHSLISAIFGYGPGSYEFLHFTKISPSKVSLATSSNNMYIDLFFENGIAGVCIVIFALLSILFVLLKKGRKNKYYFIALIEFVHLLVTSSYRADFVTPRYWAVLLIVFLLMRLGEGKEKEKQQ
ncbi:O-antigen ligase family protein [Neobacillus vireti]|uniref:O-antigen ligase family protein n=1 Tax=Neobacillus vireti TaxID=220686 RepID=UPI002FFD9BC4